MLVVAVRGREQAHDVLARRDLPTGDLGVEKPTVHLDDDAVLGLDLVLVAPGALRDLLLRIALLDRLHHPAHSIDGVDRI